MVADHLVLVLDGADAADVQADRRIEFQCVAAGGGLGTAEHDADLHADLVDKDDQGVGFRHRRREFAERWLISLACSPT